MVQGVSKVLARIASGYMYIKLLFLSLSLQEISWTDVVDNNKIEVGIYLIFSIARVEKSFLKLIRKNF